MAKELHPDTADTDGRDFILLKEQYERAKFLFSNTGSGAQTDWRVDATSSATTNWTWQTVAEVFGPAFVPKAKRHLLNELLTKRELNAVWLRVNLSDIGF